MEHIAVDLGGVNSQICIRDERGTVVLEKKHKTDELWKFFSKHSPGRVVLETCAESFKVAEQAIAAGHDVRIVPATLVRQLGVGERRMKTDRRDAEKLSEVSTRIELPSVHIPSTWSREIRSRLNSRLSLLHCRTKLINSVRGWLRAELIKLERGATATFPNRVRQKIGSLGLEMSSNIERQLNIIEALTTSIKAEDVELKVVAEGHPECCLLMTIPGIGVITSLTMLSKIDDVTRFDNAYALESYFGVTPGENSSSFKVCRTGITKCGCSQVRRVLAEACWVMRRVRPNDPLVLWSKKVEQRRGKKIALVAMMRKVAGISFAMLRDKTSYKPLKASQERPVNTKLIIVER